MSTGQITTQFRFSEMQDSKPLTVFTPPGICVETAKYPLLMAGVLATNHPSEFLSIYDHPEAWSGLDRDSILSMRRNLFRLVIPTDARTMTPKNAIETLQTIALSVSPVALGVEVSTLPPRQLRVIGGQLPSSPEVQVSSFEILSDPEISKVAERITSEDIPASEAAWKLFDYDYSLEQVARFISIGLLGKLGNRRLVPMKGAYKIAIDSFIDRAILELSESKFSDVSSIQVSSIFGDTFIVHSQPGEPRVDYLKTEIINGEISKGYNFDSSQIPVTDPKTSIYSDYAKFSAYRNLLDKKESAHITIFHLTKDSRNSVLGPWIARSGISEAMLSEPICLESRKNALTILESILEPGLPVWAEGTPLRERIMGCEVDIPQILEK